MKSTNAFKAIAFIILSLGAAGCATTRFSSTWISPDAQPVHLSGQKVLAVRLSPSDLPVVKTLVAQTESSRAVDIVVRVCGFLDRIAYAEGQLVQEGQALFQLDQKPFLAQLDAARGELKQQQAILDATGEL